MKKGKKETKPKKSFADRLMDKLIQLGAGEVNQDHFSDDSARWVELKIGDYTLNFVFDIKGEQFDSIGFYKDIWEVTDCKQLFRFDAKSNKVTNDKRSVANADAQ